VSPVEPQVNYESIIDDAVRRITRLLPDHTPKRLRDIVEEELAQLLSTRLDEHVRLWRHGA
jgi:hypothetical protein